MSLFAPSRANSSKPTYISKIADNKLQERNAKWECDIHSQPRIYYFYCIIALQMSDITGNYSVNVLVQKQNKSDNIF